MVSLTTRRHMITYIAIDMKHKVHKRIERIRNRQMMLVGRCGGGEKGPNTKFRGRRMGAGCCGLRIG